MESEYTVESEYTEECVGALVRPCSVRGGVLDDIRKYPVRGSAPIGYYLSPGLGDVGSVGTLV